ncbi:hypothetical protein ACMD2_09828 [Ananas comosus]|uniref:Uncharacterized protein n=1 Tax=Ananas comosus TaxID=4615 RepID=A0A199VKL8_ANACO|nr:hypothetical protein ACMD2_09828 [Ananas comosus]
MTQSTVSVLKAPPHVEVLKTPSIAVRAPFDLHRQFGRLLEDGVGTDTTFEVGGGEEAFSEIFWPDEGKQCRANSGFSEKPRSRVGFWCVSDSVHISPIARFDRFSCSGTSGADGF